MNRFEKASIGLALVLIGALVLIHHRQSTIDREAKAKNYTCWPGWHEIPDQERDGFIVCGDGRGNVTATVKPKKP